MISEQEFDLVLEKIGEYIKIEPSISAGFSETEATNDHLPERLRSVGYTAIAIARRRIAMVK